ncbi:unnamed protein product [Auanema sp. JU1783]|nr:unnamed protein product [Auanema sp. JU1783]
MIVSIVYTVALLFLSVTNADVVTEYVDEAVEYKPLQTKHEQIRKKIQDSNCGTLLNSSIVAQLDDLSVVVMGNLEHPTTLIVSMERRVDGFFFTLLEDFCNDANNEIKDLLSHSTLLFLMPTREMEKHNCDEYMNVSTEEANIYKLHKVFRFDFVMMFGTGGVKLRYIQQNNGLAETLMRRYQLLHPSMGLHNTDVCAGYNLLSRRGTNGLLVKQLQWSSLIHDSKDVFVRQLNGLLILIACCYEEINVDFAYSENRKSILETLKLRSTGVHFESADKTLVLNDGGYPAMRVAANINTFIALPEGETHVKVFHAESNKLITEFIVKLNDTNRYERRRIPKHLDLL